MSDRVTLTSRRAAGLAQRGCYPARWAHHPREIKDALRALGLRPMLKQCFRNAQRFLLHAPAVGVDVEYREGWALLMGIPIQHAWLSYRGKVLDLTSDRGLRYWRGYRIETREVLVTLHRTRFYGVVRPDLMHAASPYREGFEQLARMTAAHEEEAPCP